VSRPNRALAYRTPEEFASQIADNRDPTETKTGRELPPNWYCFSGPFTIPVCLTPTGTELTGHSTFTQRGLAGLVGNLEINDVGHRVQHEASAEIRDQIVKFLRTVNIV
jgi:hypothetical protein